MNKNDQKRLLRAWLEPKNKRRILKLARRYVHRFRVEPEDLVQMIFEVIWRRPEFGPDDNVVWRAQDAVVNLVKNRRRSQDYKRLRFFSHKTTTPIDDYAENEWVDEAGEVFEDENLHATTFPNPEKALLEKERVETYRAFLTELKASLAACTQRTLAGDNSRVVESTDSTQACVAWFNGIQSLVQTAVADVGVADSFGLTATEQVEVQNTLSATSVVVGKAVWSNLRCSDIGTTNSAGERLGPTCQYMMPAKRLNVFPDGVELIFLAELKELENPAYPMWLLLLELQKQHPPVMPPPVAALCDDPIAQTPNTLVELGTPARSFAALPLFDATKYTCSDCSCASITSLPDNGNTCSATGAGCGTNTQCCSGLCDATTTMLCE
jgi:DNA-directed RNA polymerase specialized sigma24 family protein